MNKISLIILSSIFAVGLSVTTVDTACAGISSVNHKVVRSDSSKATSSEKHEFNGGSHEYFQTVDDPGTILKWVEEKTDSDTYQEGWARLYLDWPVHLKSIVLRRASVGDKAFKEGWVKLEVQTAKGKWMTVFDRQGQDVKKAVTISKEVRALGPVKGARILFRSPAKITVGPIDLNY